MMRERVEFGELLWEPSDERLAGCGFRQYANWLATSGYVSNSAPSYDEVLRWSTSDVSSFWRSLDVYFETGLTRGGTPCVTGRIEEASWFPGATTNYAAEVLSRTADLEEAVVSVAEDGSRTSVSGDELARAVRHLAAELREVGVRKGDVVAAYLPNGLGAVVAFLASVYVGATWTSCPPEFGATSVLDRFSQVSPKVLFGVDSNIYRGQLRDRSDVLAQIRRGLPSLAWTFVVGEAAPAGKSITAWTPRTYGTGVDASAEAEQVAASHPLWILYSSGTTGIPKAIVHSHGGILIEQLKLHSLHLDLGRGDRFLWFSTTGWVMWNILVSSLLTGATIVTYDGDPMYPDSSQLWGLAERERLSFLGLSAGHYQEFLRQRLQPAEHFDLTSLRSLGSTGSPLTPEANAWIYDHVSPDVAVLSISGGSDVATAFVGGSAFLPVMAGVLARPLLGVDAAAVDADGTEVVDEVGDFVIRQPMPSMPIFLWGDADRSRLRKAYFAEYDGVWRHGDWVRFAGDRSCVIFGRSDATLNRGGVRMGSGEFYRVLDSMESVADSLVIDTTSVGAAKGRLIVFFVPADGWSSAEVAPRIRDEVVQQLSPRHRPDEVLAAPDIPRTLSGKRMEVPVKRLLLGGDLEGSVELGSVADPDALKFFAELDPDALIDLSEGHTARHSTDDGPAKGR